MTKLLTMDAGNLFVGDDDPTKSQFLQLKNIKLPTLTEKTISHSGGGAVLDLELGAGQMEALTLTFNLHGFNPDVMPYFMGGQARRNPYTIRGNYRDSQTHADIESRAIIRGRMVKADPSQFEPGSGSDHEYEIKEILFYQLFFDNKEKFYIDAHAGPAGVRIDGVPIFQTRASNLGLT